MPSQVTGASESPAWRTDPCCSSRPASTSSRHREELARLRRIVVGDAGEIVRPVDGDAGVLHQLRDRVELARQHEVGGPCIEGLQQRRVFPGAEGGDGVLHGLLIAVLADADGLVLILRGVEAVAVSATTSPRSPVRPYQYSNLIFSAWAEPAAAASTSAAAASFWVIVPVSVDGLPSVQRAALMRRFR